jgi:prophage regulatory protein
MKQEILRNSNPRLVRLPQVLAMLSISKSTWWAGVRSGKYPQPVKLGPRLTCWRVSDLAELAQNGLQDSSCNQDFLR